MTARHAATLLLLTAAALPAGSFQPAPPAGEAPRRSAPREEAVVAGDKDKKKDKDKDKDKEKREAESLAAGSDLRRRIFAQVVEDAEPNTFTESAVIEGAAFKFMLRSLVNVSHDAIRKHTNEQLTFDELMTRPGSYRGQVVTLARAVILEVSKAEVPPEYGLPPGYTILPAVAVDASRDVYALRILCPPGSTLFEKLDKGIREDALPVVRVSGYFMKLYARKTNDKIEPPWRRPLLVCPELELSQGAPPRKVRQELEESRTDRFLPSERIETAGAEERLLIELIKPESVVRIDGRELKGELKTSIASMVKLFKTRLPEAQAEHPSAVILISAGAGRQSLNEVVAALHAAGVQRVAVKSEL
ncbi:MAG TPA: hypothetical protein VEK08_02880 [Planctomycetota bacterium]|nr:hypothetical protein [Planctomycetota bacterium]